MLVYHNVGKGVT